MITRSEDLPGSTRVTEHQTTSETLGGRRCAFAHPPLLVVPRPSPLLPRSLQEQRHQPWRLPCVLLVPPLLQGLQREPAVLRCAEEVREGMDEGPTTQSQLLFGRV